MSYEPTNCDLGLCGPGCCGPEVSTGENHVSVHDDERGACAGDCEDCREEEGRSTAEKIPAGTSDLTPSWENVALICMDALQGAGTGSVNRELARTELLRAAKLADLYVKLQKERA